MIEKVHQHIVNELQQGARTDTIFMVTAVLFNFIILGFTLAIAANPISENAKQSDHSVIMVLLVMTIMINIIVNVALLTGKNNRNKLLGGLLAMYRDNQVAKYYDSSLLFGYGKRYLLFTAVLICLTVTIILVALSMHVL